MTCRVLLLIFGLTLCGTVAARADAVADAREKQLAQWRPSFMSVWSGDQCVQQHHQTWGDYWDTWVHRFYFGYDAYPGWFPDSDALVAKLSDASARPRLRDRLTRLGKRVAADWSKDNSCRKIRSSGLQLFESGKPALLDMGDALRAALAADNGDGKTIDKALGAIEAQVYGVLGPPQN